jgi:hypothetical protein
MAEHVTPHGAPPKQRVSARVRVAIEKMVDHALTRTEAAQLAGLTDHALYCALRKPHVQAYRYERMEVLRSSEASRTISRAVKLADTAESEHVRNDANKWLAGIDGIAPVQRSENVHLHHSAAPGLTIIYAPVAHAAAPLTLDQQPARSALPVRVPHPSELKRG